MKQIPNFFTLGNLFCGCIAIVYTLQNGLVPLYHNNEQVLIPDINGMGTQYVNVPEQIFYASLFIGLAALIDFLDGFVARLMGAASDMGKQLDSLADVVSFGVAPGMIVYQFLRLAYAQQENGLLVSGLYLLPAFLIPCAAAWRLARFNIDTASSHHFKGVPVPAAGLFIASFPLIYWTNEFSFITVILIAPWFWYVIILLVCALMVSRLPMLAIKFQGVNLNKLMPFILIGITAIVAAIFVQWFAVPICFLIYVLLSLLTLKKES